MTALCLCGAAPDPAIACDCGATFCGANHRGEHRQGGCPMYTATGPRLYEYVHPDGTLLYREIMTAEADLLRGPHVGAWVEIGPGPENGFDAPWQLRRMVDSGQWEIVDDSYQATARYAMIRPPESAVSATYGPSEPGEETYDEPATQHRYLSTACLHGKHDYCQAEVGNAGPKTPGRCKWCPAPCVCPCHDLDYQEQR